jgi:hypothetical protein
MVPVNGTGNQILGPVLQKHKFLFQFRNQFLKIGPNSTFGFINQNWQFNPPNQVAAQH